MAIANVSPGLLPVNEQKVNIMNLSEKEIVQLEQRFNSEMKDDSSQVSPSIANALVMRRYVVRLCCGDCGKTLNETKKMSQKEIYNEWTSLVVGSAFASGKCENGCRATFSDCNINTKLKIYDTIDDVYCDKEAFLDRSLNGA